MVRIELLTDVSKFIRSLGRIKDRLVEAVILGFAKTAQRARDDVRQKTRSAFKLHSDYIPQSVRSIPDPSKAKALAAAAKGLRGKRHTFQGAIYLKGTNNPKKSLAFLVDHEIGTSRRPVHGQFAIPKEVRRYRFRGARGAVLKRWSPRKILEYYNRVGSADYGSKRHGPSRRGKPKAFILRNQIVRRKTNKSRELEILYTFSKQVRIRRRWGFVDTAHRSIRQNLTNDVVTEINRLR